MPFSEYESAGKNGRTSAPFVEDRPTPWRAGRKFGWAITWLSFHHQNPVDGFETDLIPAVLTGGKMCPCGITRSTEWPQFPTARYTPETDRPVQWFGS